MLILSIRTDKPEAEIGLFEDGKKLAYETWQAHRQLAETIHLQIAKVLQFVERELSDLEGIVCFKGPGSFTGLRIGLSVGNALASGLSIPIVSEQGDNWTSTGIQRLQNGQNEQVSIPEYGSPINITKPRK